MAQANEHKNFTTQKVPKHITTQWDHYLTRHDFTVYNGYHGPRDKRIALCCECHIMESKRYTELP